MKTKLIFCVTVFGLALTFSQGVKAEESVCVTCHQGVSEQLVNDWKQSIHFENGVTCHDCHGGNPHDEASAMDPKSGFKGVPSVGQIPNLCGTCHVGVKDNYAGSLHGQAGASGPNCVTCHTAHHQQKASLDLIQPELCGSCHSFDRAQEIKTSMATVENKIEGLDHRIYNLHVEGYDVKNLKGGLFATRNRFHRLTHQINVGLIQKQTAEFSQSLLRLEEEAVAFEKTEARRRIFGIIFILFLLGASAYCGWYYKNHLD